MNKINIIVVFFVYFSLVTFPVLLLFFFFSLCLFVCSKSLPRMVTPTEKTLWSLQFSYTLTMGDLAILEQRLVFSLLCSTCFPLTVQTHNLHRCRCQQNKRRILTSSVSLICRLIHQPPTSGTVTRSIFIPIDCSGLPFPIWKANFLLNVYIRNHLSVK